MQLTETGTPKISTIIVQQSDEGKRLDVYLSRQLALSRSHVQRLVNSNLILINKEYARVSKRVKAGDILSVTVPAQEKESIIPEDIPLNIVYEDDDIIALNKPRGMVVHPAPGNKTGTLVNALLAYSKELSAIGGEDRPGIVHRLDKDTSGIILVAKNDTAHKTLAGDFKRNRIKKAYIAIVFGVPKKKKDRINLPVGRHPINRKKVAVLKEGLGRTALTYYETLEQYKEYSLLKVRPITGRTHQIRVHLKHIGHPIIGDKIYGSRHAKSFNMAGQALHAFSLAFSHPTTGKTMYIEAPIPKDMSSVVMELRDGGNNHVK